ncbi:TAF9B [Bugula neritina]|uniref:TAF9B n=1 Tax=Bugula neritina TaxID=10212 RepID=A0A7J7K5A1_BUGNE|nr:TAF9B [Bugula neritina]
MTATGGTGNASNKSQTVPHEVQVIQAVLKDMGVTDYEPAVVNQLLDFTYRYTTDILDDAKAFSAHAGKKSIDVEDTKLAVQLKLDKSYTNPPPRELLLDVATHRNSQSLPLIKPYTGPKLPPDRYCLSAMNYQLRNSKRQVLSYNVQHTTVGRQVSKGSLLSPSVSYVNRPDSSNGRQPALYRQTSVTNAGGSIQQPFQGGMMTSTQSVKRKLDQVDE